MTEDEIVKDMENYVRVGFSYMPAELWLWALRSMQEKKEKFRLERNELLKIALTLKKQVDSLLSVKEDLQMQNQNLRSCIKNHEVVWKREAERAYKESEKNLVERYEKEKVIEYGIGKAVGILEGRYVKAERIKELKKSVRAELEGFFLKEEKEEIEELNKRLCEVIDAVLVKKEDEEKKEDENE